MSATRRFSADMALAALDAMVDHIAQTEGFDRNNGTSQLKPKTRMSDEDVDRAVAYGRMRAFEQFAAAILEKRVDRLAPHPSKSKGDTE